LSPPLDTTLSPEMLGVLNDKLRTMSMQNRIRKDIIDFTMENEQQKEKEIIITLMNVLC